MALDGSGGNDGEQMNKTPIVDLYKGREYVVVWGTEIASQTLYVRLDSILFDPEFLAGCIRRALLIYDLVYLSITCDTNVEGRPLLELLDCLLDKGVDLKRVVLLVPSAPVWEAWHWAMGQIQRSRAYAKWAPLDRCHSTAWMDTDKHMRRWLWTR